MDLKLLKQVLRKKMLGILQTLQRGHKQLKLDKQITLKVSWRETSPIKVSESILPLVSEMTISVQRKTFKRYMVKRMSN